MTPQYSMTPHRSVPSRVSLIVALVLLSTAHQADAGPREIQTPESLSADWLVATRGYKATLFGLEKPAEIFGLSNGLVRREFSAPTIGGFLACTRYENERTGESLVRSVRPEARVVIDGETYDIGGAVGQTNHAFLDARELAKLKANPGAFRFVGRSRQAIDERLAWKRVRHHAPDASWPPKGLGLRLDFDPPEGVEKLRGIRVSVHYELFDGIPALSKWITVRNDSGRKIDVDSFTSEILAVVEHDNPVEYRDGVEPLPPQSLHVETDYAFGGFTHRNARRHTVHWKPDLAYATQVNYLRRSPCLLEVSPTVGPDQTIAPGEVFESFRTFELVHDARANRERRGLALRRLYRTIAPWVTENPLIFHVVSSDEMIVRRAIDQAAECGFEMVSLSFGSGLDMENEDPAYRAKFRRLANYARGKGIEIGGYSLLSSRRVRPDSDNCVNPRTGKPGGQTHGYCPALASGWGQDYFRKLREFFDTTGFSQFTHDGSYPGDLDASARPPLQKGLDDSRWVQWRIITDFYKFLRARGAYLRVPDYYFLSGANECGMGYRETNWSLPRAQQIIHTRQNIFDGTWEKTPSMGWMFVPLTQYHGGGSAATIEPLDDHIDHYSRMLASNLGLGVQAVYRGLRLYDTDRVRDMVRRHVDWYKKHREILESDLIHGRRCDGRRLDWMLHVNPEGRERAMLLVFNPTAEKLSETLEIDLYYSGLRDRARVSIPSGDREILGLREGSSVTLHVEVEAEGWTWFVFENAS